jgi:diguanylate cyclase (GGDEF)-like protein
LDTTTKPQPADPVLDDVLARLSARLKLDGWMVVRRGGDELSVVAVRGDRLGLEVGMRMPWEDTVCARMAAGEGPRAAPILGEVPPYARAPVARTLEMGAYIGVPIEGDEGVIGSLCGFDRGARGAELADELPVLELCAGLIGRLWQAERDARTDPLTELPNRRTWAESLSREEERCRRFGHPAAVLAVDLDDFKRVNDRLGHPVGDEHLRRAAGAIAASVREHDVVARWGGDEFCVLAVECDEEAARALSERVGRALGEAGVAASLGLARRCERGLAGAVEEAFASLREAKAADAVARLG